MKRYFTLAIALAALIAGSAWAQAKPPAEPDLSKYKIVIGTGGVGGTYDVMVGKELMGMCKQGDTFGVVNRDGGTIANIDMILANKQDAGVGQEDVLFLKKATNPEVNQLKVLFPLHPEEIHVFTLKDTGLQAAGTVKESYMGMKKETIAGAPIVFNSVGDLAGYKVAAWGGSYDTARLIRANGGIAFEPVQAKNMAEAFTMLRSKQVQAVLAVAGAPAQNFQEITDTNVKLVGFKDETVQKLMVIYSGGSILNYTNLGAEGIKTVSTNAVMFTREFSDPSLISALVELRACEMSAVPKLRDTRGAHKKWRQVIVGGKSKWPMYDLPVAKAAPAKTKK